MPQSGRPTSQQKTSASPVKRWLWIAVPSVVVLALAIFVFWPALQVRLWISSLHADDPQAIAAARDALIQSRREGLDDDLFAILVDPGESFAVRTLVGRILVKRNRVPYLEQALVSDELGRRTAALTVLQEQRWFKDTYPGDPRYRVKETVLKWVGREGDPSRQTAVKLARELGVAEALPAIRDLIQRSPPGGTSRAAQDLVIEAMGSAAGFKDCVCLPQVADLALNEPEDNVRRVALNILVRAVKGPQPYCPDAMPLETVKIAVREGLKAGRITKIMSMLILSQEAAWADEAFDALMAILDEPGDGVLRRHALNALGGTTSERLAQRLPRYFSDVDASVRSEAVTAAQLFGAGPEPKARFEGCLIGILRDETESDAAWDAAMRTLKSKAGRWVGLPGPVEAAASGAAGAEELEKFRRQMYERGESHGLSREDWARAWFAWWAEDLGLGAEEVTAAQATRDAFWSAARRKDAEAARRALETRPRPDVRGLFCYEEGWLGARP